MTEMEFWGMAGVFGALWFANLSGAAGAGLIVPISIIFFHFDPKNAIALSNFSVFVSSITRLLYLRNEPHPLKRGTGKVIDYNLLVLMIPSIVSGV